MTVQIQSSSRKPIFKNRVVHLVHDEPKFFGYIFEYFADPESVFLVLGSQRATDPTRDDVVYAADTTMFSTELRGALCVISHGMFAQQVKILSQLPESVPVAWVLFGAEYHNTRPEFRGNLYFPKTEELWDQIRSGSPSMPLIRMFGVARRWLQARMSTRAFGMSIKRVNRIGAFLEDEYKLVADTLELKAKWNFVSYYNIEETLGKGVIDKVVSGRDVLLGNSSTAENNHVDAFQMLSPLRSEFRKLLVPLSYGNVSYRNRIVEIGAELFGDQFDPMCEFVERSSYNKRLLSCKVAIMNHRRQQAVGNVITLLWLGAKVFLTEESTVRQFFKREGSHIFSVENDLHGPGSLCQLPSGKIQHNRDVLSGIFGKKKVIRAAQRLVKDLKGLA